MREQEIKAYIYDEIVPRYSAFDKAHKEDHALTVIRQSEALLDGRAAWLAELTNLMLEITRRAGAALVPVVIRNRLPVPLWVMVYLPVVPTFSKMMYLSILMLLDASTESPRMYSLPPSATAAIADAREL